MRNHPAREVVMAQLHPAREPGPDQRPQPMGLKSPRHTQRSAATPPAAVTPKDNLAWEQRPGLWDSQQAKNMKNSTRRGQPAKTNKAARTGPEDKRPDSSGPQPHCRLLPAPPSHVTTTPLKPSWEDCLGPPLAEISKLSGI